MRSCTSPVGRLESHQRGFWIDTPFQMQKTKALNWLFPECVRRVEKYSTRRQAYSYFLGGTCSGNTRGKTWDLTRPCTSDLCHMTLSWVGFLTLAPGRRRPGMLQFMGSQRVGHDSDWTELKNNLDIDSFRILFQNVPYYISHIFWHSHFSKNFLKPKDQN